MIPTEVHLLCELAASFFSRGLAFGSTGNLSVRVGDTVWITPTGKSLRHLEPDSLARVSMTGEVLGPVAPSKEYPFHLGCYRSGEARGVAAVVHLHCTHCVALSCLEEIDERNLLPPLTPYYYMRVSPVAVVPYFTPGSQELAQAVESAAAWSDSLLLRNHGAIALGKSLSEAADRLEEFEETAKLAFLLRGDRVRMIPPEERELLAQKFARPL